VDVAEVHPKLTQLQEVVLLQGNKLVKQLGGLKGKIEKIKESQSK
jgi:hypothetical protein